MRRKLFRTFSTFATMLAMGLAIAALAEDGHKHGAPLHGGKVAMTKEYHFEVVFAKDGLKVFPRDHDDQRLDASKLTGTATFYHPNSPKAWFERKLSPTAAGPGRSVSFLGCVIDLSKVPTKGATVEFRIDGLPEAAEKTATFTLPFSLPATGQILIGKPTPADAQAIAAQKICPVSKEELGAMGEPLKLTRDGKSIFLCCKGCLKKVQANPNAYFGAPADKK